MKFKGSIIINQSQEKVAALFIDPKYLKHYQDGFLRKELISGIAGEDGTISKMYYKQGSGEMELTETITANLLPDSFEGHYHHIHMDNTLKSIFTPISETQTRFDWEGEYIEVRGFMPKMMMVLMPWMFKRQVKKWMNNFKVFVEAQ